MAFWISHLGNTIYITLDLIDDYANVFSVPFLVVNALVLTNVRPLHSLCKSIVQTLTLIFRYSCWLVLHHGRCHRLESEDAEQRDQASIAHLRCATRLDSLYVIRMNILHPAF